MPECDHEDSRPKSLSDKMEKSLLDKRWVFLSDAIDADSAKSTILKLLYLDQLATKPILLIINSPGGSVDSGLAIWDHIKMLNSPVVTLVSGLAASMGSLLSLVAPKGKRLATPYSRIMIHQPLIQGVIRGQATDLDIQAKEILKTRETIIEIYSTATGHSHDKVEEAIMRDNWKSAEEAKEWKLIDHIIKSKKDLDAHFC